MSARVHGHPPFLRKSRRPDSLAKRSRRWLLGGGALLLAYALVFGEGGLLRWMALRSEHRELVQRQEQLELAQRRLDERLAALAQTGSFELERVARDIHRLQRPEESVLQVIDPSGDALP